MKDYDGMTIAGDIWFLAKALAVGTVTLSVFTASLVFLKVALDVAVSMI